MIAKEIKLLDIVYQDCNVIFKAGDTVAGHVVLELGQEVKVKGIRVELLGMARVHWDEKRAYTKGSASRLSHKNTEVYLEETCSILNKAGTLQPGRHTYPFAVRLPAYLPASFDGQWGRIIYYARAVVDRRWKGSLDQSRTFIVQGSLDLNADPETRSGMEVHGDALVGPLCCRSGHLEGQLLIERCGFVPGEELAFTAKVENCSKRKASSRVNLVQVTVFRADEKVKRTSTVLRSASTEDVEPGHSQAWEGSIDSIPMIPPSKLGGGCRLIEVKYQLVLVSIVSGPGQDLEVPLDVVIGTVPLRRTRSPHVIHQHT